MLSLTSTAAGNALSAKGLGKIPRWAWWSVPLLLVYILYGRSLFFPLYWDDVSHYSWTRGTFTQIWLSQIGYQFYRPVLFTFYKVVFDYFTPRFIFLCYSLALMLHGLSGVLVGKLTVLFACQQQRLSLRKEDLSWLLGPIAALLFVAYPFAAFAVPSLATIYYVGVTNLTLIGLYAALRFTHQPQKRYWWGLAFFISILSPFIYEAGIMAGIVIVLGVIAYDGRTAWRHKWHWGLLLLAGTAFLPLWLVLTKRGDSFAWPGWEVEAGPLSFLLQGVTFAVQPLAGLLKDRLGWESAGAVWAVGLPALAMLIVLLGRIRQWRLLACALGWSALMSAPALVSLPTLYILGSPRLLYPLAPGAAWLWAVGLWSIAALARSSRVRVWLALGGTCLVVALPIRFVQDKMSLYQIGMDQITQLFSIVRAHPTEEQLIVNPVSWLASESEIYCLGYYGVPIMPSYLHLDQVVKTNLHFQPNLKRANMPAVREVPSGLLYEVNSDQDVPLDWAAMAAQASTYDRVWVTTFPGRRIALEETGSVRRGEATRPAYLANFEQLVFLVSGQYDVEGGEMVVALNWKYLGPDPNATVFRHVFDCAGNILGLGDGYVLGRMLPFGFLAPGTEVRDVRRIQLKAFSPDGCYQVEIGLFRPDGSRVAALALDGTAYENATVPLYAVR